MPFDRLSKIEIQYDLLQEQLNSKELEKLTAPFGDQARIQQQIDLFLAPSLQECKQKYLVALAEGSSLDTLTEKQASVVVAEVVDELTVAQGIATDPRLVAMVAEILAKLNEPEGPVVRLKLGVKLPLEMFEAGAEWEGDAVSLWKTHCPTFESWRSKAAKKLFPPD
jgi:hypothetical protein